MDAAGQRLRDHIGPCYQQVHGDKVAGPGLSLQHARNLRSAHPAHGATSSGIESCLKAAIPAAVVASVGTLSEGATWAIASCSGGNVIKHAVSSYWVVQAAKA